MLGAKERLVALDVDVDIGGHVLRHGVQAVGAAGELGRGEHAGPAALTAECGDFVGVGGDDHVVQRGAGAGGGVDPCQQRLTGDGQQHLARQARRGQAGGDDAEDFCAGESHRVESSESSRTSSSCPALRAAR